MVDLTWKVFQKTGNIKTYLLFKHLRDEHKGHTSDIQHVEKVSAHIVNKRG